MYIYIFTHIYIHNIYIYIYLFNSGWFKHHLEKVSPPLIEKHMMISFFANFTIFYVCKIYVHLLMSTEKNWYDIMVFFGMLFFTGGMSPLWGHVFFCLAPGEWTVHLPGQHQNVTPKKKGVFILRECSKNGLCFQENSGVVVYQIHCRNIWCNDVYWFSESIKETMYTLGTEAPTEITQQDLDIVIRAANNRQGPF